MKLASSWPNAYLDADLPDEAIEILLCAVTDSSRLHGPLAERTIATRIRLGDAYVAAGHLFDASGVHENLLADVRAAHDLEHLLVERVAAIADSTMRTLEAEHGPISDTW